MRHLQDVDFKLLRIFRAIVEAGGLVGAQLTLNVSQSTLSTQLADLEKRLGFVVCYRGRAGFSLTKAGQQIYDATNDLFSAADRFQNTAASISGELKGVLRLGIVDAMFSNSVWDLAAILSEFNERAKKAVIELTMDSPGDMERMILNGTRDVALGGSFFRKTVGITYVPLFKELHSLFAADDHPLTRQSSVNAEGVQKYPFVARKYLHRYDLERVGHLSPAAVVETMEAQAILIKSGRFIGYLPVHYAATLPGVRQLNVPQPLEYYSPFYVLHKPDADENLLIRNFLNRIRERPLGLNKDSRAVLPPGDPLPKARNQPTTSAMSM